MKTTKTAKEKQKERAFISVLLRHCELLNTSPKTPMQQKQAEHITKLAETLINKRRKTL